MTDQGRADSRPLVPNETLAEALLDPQERTRLGLDPRDDADLAVIVELNLRHVEGIQGAEREFFRLYGDKLPARERPWFVANTYYQCTLSVNDARMLVLADASDSGPGQRAIYRIWPDFPVQALIDRSTSMIKADAAQRSYDASGADTVWAVIDSGIDQHHPHFAHHQNLQGDVAGLHCDFTVPEVDGLPPLGSALTDDFGHGTHVAGVIAGELPRVAWDEHKVRVLQQVADAGGNGSSFDDRDLNRVQRLAGVAPRCKLVSLKVLDSQGTGGTARIMRALRYVRELNGLGKVMRIHGVNLSVGYEFDARWFACGQSPICVEVDRLVRSGVVVVVAAGNTGYGRLSAAARPTSTGLSLTINDPGNADLAITVGSTHRDMPHTYGVSYFSSKGPTGDGRMKPDLVAPGERITSCGVGAKRPPGSDAAHATYVDDSGTSLAAPHVSGAIAAFLSIRQEFIGKPEVVKRIFLDSATSLGRVEHFQGRGMVDLMRAIQAV